MYLGKGQQQMDRDNARSGTFDALAKAGIIQNDRQIAEDPLVIFRDWSRPRVEVMVEELVGR
jgi:Holliday junction resolvase RusA-like endonuclease